MNYAVLQYADKKRQFANVAPNLFTYFLKFFTDFFWHAMCNCCFDSRNVVNRNANAGGNNRRCLRKRRAAHTPLAAK